MASIIHSVHATPVTGVSPASALHSSSKTSSPMGTEFKELLGDMFDGTKKAAAQIEKDNLHQITGEVDFTKLSTNMVQLETMVQGMVAVRDKLIGAWSELNKMQI